MFAGPKREKSEKEIMQTYPFIIASDFCGLWLQWKFYCQSVCCAALVRVMLDRAVGPAGRDWS